MPRSSPECRQIHTEPHSTKRAVWLSLLAPIALVLEGEARRSSAQLISHVQARDGGILPATSKGVKNEEMVHSFGHAKSLQNVLFSGSNWVYAPLRVFKNQCVILADYIWMCPVRIQGRIKCSRGGTQRSPQQGGNESSTGLGTCGHLCPSVVMSALALTLGSLPLHHRPAWSCVLVWVTCSLSSSPCPLVQAPLPAFYFLGYLPQVTFWHLKHTENFHLSYFISQTLPSDCSFYLVLGSALISKRQHCIIFLWLFLWLFIIFFVNKISYVSFKAVPRLSFYYSLPVSSLFLS